MVLQLRDKPVKQTVHVLSSAEKTNLRSRCLCDLHPVGSSSGATLLTTRRKRKFTDADVITELNLLSPILWKVQQLRRKRAPAKKTSIANRAEKWKRSKLRKALVNVFYLRAVQCFPRSLRWRWDESLRKWSRENKQCTCCAFWAV